MTSFREHEASYRRGWVLKVLADSNDQGCNVGLIQQLVRMAGFRAPLDLIEDDLAWLGERSLVEVREVSGLSIARLLQRGRDVVTGDTRVPGIERAE